MDVECECESPIVLSRDTMHSVHVTQQGAQALSCQTRVTTQELFRGPHGSLLERGCSQSLEECSGLPQHKTLPNGIVGVIPNVLAVSGLVVLSSPLASAFFWAVLHPCRLCRMSCPFPLHFVVGLALAFADCFNVRVSLPSRIPPSVFFERHGHILEGARCPTDQFGRLNGMHWAM